MMPPLTASYVAGFLSVSFVMQLYKNVSCMCVKKISGRILWGFYSGVSPQRVGTNECLKTFETCMHPT